MSAVFLDMTLVAEDLDVRMGEVPPDVDPVSTVPASAFHEGVLRPATEVSWDDVVELVGVSSRRFVVDVDGATTSSLHSLEDVHHSLAPFEAPVYFSRSVHFCGLHSSGSARGHPGR